MTLSSTDLNCAPDCLAGKIIVVTGAGDGIGKTAACTYAAHGATVVLMGRTIPKLEAVYDSIIANGHPQPAIYPMDFMGAVETDYADLANALSKEYGKLDGLLLNAGMLGHQTPISNYDFDTWAQVMQVNVNSPFMMIRALTPLLANSTNASVIATSSSVANEGRAYWGAYSVSKAAFKNLVEILTQEWDGTAPIRINSLNPGGTRTAMRAKAYPAENPEKVPTPAQHMPLYLYLMSDKSVGTCGQYLHARDYL